MRVLVLVVLAMSASIAAYGQVQAQDAQKPKVRLNSAGTAGMPSDRIREFHVSIGGGARVGGGRMIFQGTSGKQALPPSHFGHEHTAGQPSSQTVAIVRPSEKYPGRVIVSLDKEELPAEMADLKLKLEFDSSNGASLNGTGSRYLVPPGLGKFQFGDVELSTEDSSSWSIIEMTEDSAPIVVQGDIELIPTEKANDQST